MNIFPEKGYDKANIEISNDEIKTYLDARWISSCESCYRIFGFSLHDNQPSVYRLELHLPDQQITSFTTNSDPINLVNNNKKTKLMAWFDFNRASDLGQNLLYTEFPSYFTFASNHWKPRVNAQRFKTIGRMYLANPSEGEKYYLRLLLTQRRGMTSFEDLKTINGNIYETYKQTCEAMGLLESDEEWDKLLEESSSYQIPTQMRRLFANILMYCRPRNPGELWGKYLFDLTTDLVHRVSEESRDVNELSENLRQQV